MISFIVGRLGKDAINGTSKNGKPYMGFTMCENVYQNGETVSVWYNVTSFNQYDFGKQPYLKAGNLVSVVGETTVKPSISPNGKLYINYDVLASTINFINVGKKKEENENSTPVTTGDLSELNKEIVSETTIEKVEPVISVPTNNNVSNDEEDDELPF